MARVLKGRLNGCIVSTRHQSRLEEIFPSGARVVNRPLASVCPVLLPLAGNAPSTSSETAACRTGFRVDASTTHPTTFPHDGRLIVGPAPAGDAASAAGAAGSPAGAANPAPGTEHSA